MSLIPLSYIMRIFIKNAVSILMISAFTVSSAGSMERDNSYKTRRVISLAKFYDVYSTDVKDIQDKNFSNGDYIAGFDYENESCRMLMISKKVILKVVNSGGDYFFEGFPEKTPQFYGRRKEKLYPLGEGGGKKFQMKGEEGNLIKLSWVNGVGNELCKVTLKFIFIDRS